jgi:starch synthase (maltosyl-transferring)
MYELARIGFTQSYTYFTWRNTKAELQAYLEEITRPPVSEFFRPNFWPATPDILPGALQVGGPSAFRQRLILAATLCSNYGIYGPGYELCENTPSSPGPGKTESEEYLDSEKYEIRQRDRNAPGSLVPLIRLLNQIRRNNRSLQSNRSLHFHKVDNEQLICFSKTTPDFANTILVIVNLDAKNLQCGSIDLDIEQLGILQDAEFVVEELLTGEHDVWHGSRNSVSLDPRDRQASIYRVSHPYPCSPEQLGASAASVEIRRPVFWREEE